jgi:ABC-type Fe3+-hydroxamate transport system substrate-binding protein
LQAIRKVGGTKNPDLAAIRDISPDLILMNGEENRREDIEKLAAEYPVDVTQPRKVDGVPALLRHFGNLCGVRGEADSLARQVEARLEKARSAPVPAFTYVYFIWKDPWMAAGSSTYIASVCELAGGNPPPGMPAGTEYPALTIDQVVSSRPDVILLPDEPYRFTKEHRRWWEERCPGVLALQVPGDDYCWHGVRTLGGIDASCRLASDVAAFSAERGREPLPAGLQGRNQRDPRGSAGSEG